MKTHKVLATIITLSAATILGATTVQAVPVAQTKNTSDATVTLGAGDTSAPDLIDPTIPSGKTENTGLLTIDNLTPFVFGAQNLTGSSATYSITSAKANVQVTDRRGTGAGWQLQVSASAFKDKTDATKVLKAAQLTIPVGAVVSTEGNQSEPPTASVAVLDASENGNSAVLFQAIKNTGMGGWANKFTPADVKLVVPGGNFAGEYTSTLTWVLGDTPNG